MKKLLEIFGYVFILIGILGFIPALTPDGFLLGLFMVNAVHNIVHILSGVLAIYFAKQSDKAAATFAYAFAGVYALVTLLGFTTGTLFGLMGLNTADNWLHVLFTMVFAYIGYSLMPKHDYEHVEATTEPVV
jgi:hypothetical protein